jgi:hypothetical protein
VADCRDEVSDQPRVVARRREYDCPWFQVVVKDVRYPGQTHERSFYSVQINDWATVLAVDGEGRIPLVRQYRPVIERVGLELPAGAVHTAPQKTSRDASSWRRRGTRRTSSSRSVPSSPRQDD